MLYLIFKLCEIGLNTVTKLESRNDACKASFLVWYDRHIKSRLAPGLVVFDQRNKSAISFFRHPVQGDETKGSAIDAVAAAAFFGRPIVENMT